MALAPIAQAAAPYARIAGSFIARRSVAAARVWISQYGVPAATAFAFAADASRQFKRGAAITAEYPLTDEEYEALEEESKSGEQREVRVCYQTIRMSRDGFAATGIKSPVGVFSHWCLEVGGNYYELREYDPAKEAEAELRMNRTILYRELGKESRKIKLEVSTNRTLHESVQFQNVGATCLDDDTIVQLASRIFSRFGEGYDPWIDNCQHFSQLLAEAICGRNSRDEVRRFFDSRSVMKLPVAASWLVAPVYGAVVALHHGLELGEFKNAGDVERVVNNMEKWILHPRVYAARRRAQFWK